MKSSVLGNDTSEIEVTHVSVHGIWLLTHDEELFMPYENFPWFRQQTIEAILNVEEPSPDHYYWPAIDIDLTKEIIKYPDRFPLKAKITK